MGVRSGYPAFDDRSVGFVIMCDSIRSAHADRLREFRLLRGPESYKHRFANLRTAPYDASAAADSDCRSGIGFR